ncbi:hypothetical protein P5G50_15420 [Leifsonia sp. F6_8S_P_1B]|uniref:Uncharacterized protein n=1 Tax=Leifsonia williamsii TaxID=3035919 RepID=A0ABT8KGE3_9MICO|nr:hypothetical protein [Leifsonia williamsii]MDN4615841.1 hypothetical protein [Leifsonia williamsii]
MQVSAGGSGDVGPLVLFLALAGLFTLLGVYLLLRPGSAAAFFADAEARRRFRPRDARALGAVFAGGGAALIALGILRLATLL